MQLKFDVTSTQVFLVNTAPDDPELSNKWVAFLNRRDYEISNYFVICIDHFEEKYIFHYPKK